MTTKDISGRYIIYGANIDEHEEGNAGLDPERQRVTQYSPVYGTDDRDEAKAIVNAGGFNNGEDFVSVMWAEDTTDGGIFGDKPNTSISKNMPSKGQS